MYLKYLDSSTDSEIVAILTALSIEQEFELPILKMGEPSMVFNAILETLND
jgi:hypothetical protein